MPIVRDRYPWKYEVAVEITRARHTGTKPSTLWIEHMYRPGPRVDRIDPPRAIDLQRRDLS